jgi:iron complex transport system substrate-binding protein
MSSRPPRIASLLPAATEIVCALGLGDQLVGVSHECDFPAGTSVLPRLTRSRDVGGSSAAIDRSVRAALEQGLSIYALDGDALRAARPDLVVTQDLCDVCAIPSRDVERGLVELGLADTRVVRLHPLQLADVLGDVERVARAAGVEARGSELARELRSRLEGLARPVADGSRAPRVLTVEWLSPVMAGGTWMPELVSLAGGVALAASAGEPARTLSDAELGALAPDVVVFKPCGFTLERSLAERERIATVVELLGGAARERAAVFVADGNAFFNRPGPRLVESLEILLACLHEDVWRERAAQLAGRVARWTDVRRGA